jgi:predicted lipase
VASQEIKLSKTAHYLKNGLALAQLAKLAYTKVPGTLSDKLKSTFPKVTHLYNNPAQGFVCANDTDIVVVFRGTDQPTDWISNVRYKQIAGYGGYVHEGFAEQLRGLESRMLSAVKKYHDNKQTIWVSGHSLGGALATLAAKKLGTINNKPYMLNTFGGPRVLNPAAAKAFKQTMYRFVNDQDLVPHIPSRGLINRYEHVGRRVHFTKAGKISTDKQSWLKAAEALSRVSTRGVGRVAKNAISDHAMSQYLRKIKLNVT